MDYIVLIILIVVFALLVWWFVRGKPRGPSKGVSRPRGHRFTGQPLATELVKGVDQLQRRNARWPEIQQVLGTSDILATIRLSLSACLCSRAQTILKDTRPMGDAVHTPPG
jgi:hypothetical protein